MQLDTNSTHSIHCWFSWCCFFRIIQRVFVSQYSSTFFLSYFSLFLHLALPLFPHICQLQNLLCRQKFSFLWKKNRVKRILLIVFLDIGDFSPCLQHDTLHAFEPSKWLTDCKFTYIWMWFGLFILKNSLWIF